jgi:hypothetical protein
VLGAATPITLAGIIPGNICIIISLSIIYSIALHKMNNVDLELIKYAVDNDCTDGPLKMALRQYLVEYLKDIRMVRAGLSLVYILVIIIISIIAGICWKERHSLSCCCCRGKIGIDESNKVGDGNNDR